jgi:hypothetical protein
MKLLSNDWFTPTQTRQIPASMRTALARAGVEIPATGTINLGKLDAALASQGLNYRRRLEIKATLRSQGILA